MAVPQVVSDTPSAGIVGRMRPSGVTIALIAAALFLGPPSVGLARWSLSAQVSPTPPHVLDTMMVLRVDTFAHRRHTSLSCLTCHVPHSGALLAFVPPRGCQTCHHQSPGENRCPSCHPPAKLAAPLARVVTVTVRGQPPRPRTVGFRHEFHVSRPCSGCHNQPVWLEPADSILTCTACHDDHHQAGRNCSVCHNDSAAFAPHAPPAEAHDRCDRCHQLRTIAGLVPERALCLTCHPSRQTHGAPKECTLCHFQQDPASYRSRLVTGHP